MRAMLMLCVLLVALCDEVYATPSCGSTIAASGAVQITSSMLCPGKVGLKIPASNVDVYCNYNAITSTSGIAGGVGVDITGHHVRLHACRVNGWKDAGLYVHGVPGAKVQGFATDHTALFGNKTGAKIVEAQDPWLTDMDVYDNTTGVDFQNTLSGGTINALLHDNAKYGYRGYNAQWDWHGNVVWYNNATLDGYWTGAYASVTSSYGWIEGKLCPRVPADIQGWIGRIRLDNGAHHLAFNHIQYQSLTHGQSTHHNVFIQWLCS